MEKWYYRWLRLITMLFPVRIYLVRGPWHFGDCNIFLPNIKRPKKVLRSERGAPAALCHMVNLALVIALRP